jgi:phosphopantothenoylcysteine synthetase/decarboxylase
MAMANILFVQPEDRLRTLLKGGHRRMDDDDNDDDDDDDDETAVKMGAGNAKRSLDTVTR